MIASPNSISNLQLKYRQYHQKLHLTEEAKTRTLELINELALIQLIYTTTKQQNKKAIDEKLKQVEKILEGKLKGQGWLNYFSKISEVVSLQQVWRIISTFENDPRQHLINDIWKLKLSTIKKSVIVASTITPT